jgi:hypothetical protein
MEGRRRKARNAASFAQHTFVDTYLLPNKYSK